MEETGGSFSLNPVIAAVTGSDSSGKKDGCGERAESHDSLYGTVPV